MTEPYSPILKSRESQIHGGAFVGNQYRFTADSANELMLWSRRQRRRMLSGSMENPARTSPTQKY